MQVKKLIIVAAVAAAAGGCADVDQDAAVRETDAASARAAAEARAPGAAAAGSVGGRGAAAAASALGRGDASLPPDSIERGRLDDGWRRFAGAPAVAASSDPLGEEWADITREAVNRPGAVPLSGDVSGPSVARVQILLDRVAFSPGVIDGRWGKNTEKAVYWYQRHQGLDATGTVDRATLDRLGRAAERPPIARHTLIASDVEGPFVDIPTDIYAQAKLECMCYRSLEEKLAEKFHTTPELLRQLNPGLDLNAVRSGATIAAPAVRDSAGPSRGDIARIVVSDGGHYVHGLDASGRVIYHFPSTLGSEYAPSPSGDYRIAAIARDPTWHYQPDPLTGEPDNQPDAVIPAGPNNPVGVVWLDLSKPHYGIHGTSAPETIGYVTSHGCVRLTNWDAAFLADRVAQGTPVEFTAGARQPVGDSAGRAGR